MPRLTQNKETMLAPAFCLTDVRDSAKPSSSRGRQNPRPERHADTEPFGVHPLGCLGSLRFPSATYPKAKGCTPNATVPLRLVLAVLFAGLLIGRAAAQTDQTIYTDSLQNNWQAWGWAAAINYNNTSPVHLGADSISFQINSTVSSWDAIYIHHDAFDSSPYTNVTFWVNGGSTGGQRFQLKALLNGTDQPGVPIGPLAPNSWQQITISLTALGVANRPDVTGFWFMDALGTPQPVFYLDDIALVAAGAPPVTNSTVSIVVDGALNRHPINPFIYGTAFATSNQLADLNSPLNRSGGNTETRYNWQINAHNHAADWYFESLADDSVSRRPVQQPTSSSPTAKTAARNR